jgi:hypothetical protein
LPIIGRFQLSGPRLILHEEFFRLGEKQCIFSLFQDLIKEYRDVHVPTAPPLKAPRRI